MKFIAFYLEAHKSVQAQSKPIVVTTDAENNSAFENVHSGIFNSSSAR